MSARLTWKETRQLAGRWLKFSTVGGMGIVVQLAALAALKSALGLHYLTATAVAVELAVLHNFAWHERWTWMERTQGNRNLRPVAGRLFRFNLTTGLISIAANVVLMRLLAGQLHLHYLVANILAIAICSLANFLASEFLVFRAARG